VDLTRDGFIAAHSQQPTVCSTTMFHPYGSRQHRHISTYVENYLQENKN